ncbi:GIY-YIG nuclease family protein [Paracoccus sp. SJTW-4]|uniref:GIY-YIG nuclease family protein n=1 Tax=Paracoccus sp. SJTW-4 TaxID=3078428 RepID=UPI0039EAF18D
MTATLTLSDIWHPASLTDYKVHFARWNGETHPLHVLARSMDEWRQWQEWHPHRDDFNRPYIFSLAQVPEQNDIWMFGGIWAVTGKGIRADGRPHYQVQLTGELSGAVARLNLHRIHRQRGTRLNLENHYAHFIITEVLARRYSGRAFPGYHSVNLDFHELEGLVRNDSPDWATALSHVKGVYLVTDTCTQRRYVGSAYGEWGIWSRWKTYIQLGHGGNSEMVELLRDHDLGYCRRNFKFALLEHMDSRTDDNLVIQRESYWKQVLDSRNLITGMNAN